MNVFGFKSNKCKEEVVAKLDVFNAVYPVGSIYMSASNVNPTTLFGGTWEQITGRFLLASSNSHSLGQTGGAETVSYTPAGAVGNHTLTAAEMPKHSHTYAKPAANTGSTTLTTAMIPAHTHSYGKANTKTGSTTLTVDQIPSHTHKFNFMNLDTSGGAKVVANGSYFSRRSQYDIYGAYPETQATGGGQGHTHDLSVINSTSGSAGSGGGHTHTISTASTASSEAGSGGAHNHGFTGTAANISTMSPFVVVNVWKRTA